MHTLPVKTGTRTLVRLVKILSGLSLDTALASTPMLLGCPSWQPYRGLCVPIRLFLA
ncbi:hypothetical protein [Pseudomonas nicosulfuronedens]